VSGAGNYFRDDDDSYLLVLEAKWEKSGQHSRILNKLGIFIP
jgi:hypothetical protein